MKVAREHLLRAALRTGLVVREISIVEYGSFCQGGGNQGKERKFAERGWNAVIRRSAVGLELLVMWKKSWFS